MAITINEPLTVEIKADDVWKKLNISFPMDYDPYTYKNTNTYTGPSVVKARGKDVDRMILEKKPRGVIASTPSSMHIKWVHNVTTVSDYGYPIYPIPGTVYYSAVEDSLLVLGEMSTEEVVAVSGTGSVKHAEIIRDELATKLLWELDNKPSVREAVPGIFDIGGGVSLVTGVVGKMRKNASKATLLRQSLPVSNMSTCKVRGSATVEYGLLGSDTSEAGKLRGILEPREKARLIIIVDRTHSMEDTLKYLCSSVAAYVLRSSSARFLIEDIYVILVSGVESEQPVKVLPRTIVGKHRDVLGLRFADIITPDSKDAGMAYGSAFALAAKIAKSSVNKTRNILAFVHDSAPSDNDPVHWETALSTLGEYVDGGYAFLVAHSGSINNLWFSEQVALAINGEYGTSRRVTVPTFLASITNAASAIITGYKVGVGYSVYRYYNTSQKQATSRRVATELGVDYDRLLFPWRGSGNTTPILFCAVWDGLFMATTPMYRGYDINTYVPVGSGRKRINSGGLCIVLDSSPEDIMNGKGLD